MYYVYMPTYISLINTIIFTKEISLIKETKSSVLGIICNTVNVFHTPLPFYATQIINLFLNSRSTSIHDTME